MFDHYNLGEVLKTNQSQKKTIKLSVWDVSGSEKHASLRKFAYSKADAIIFCFDLADGKHFDPKGEQHRKEYEEGKKKDGSETYEEFMKRYQINKSFESIRHQWLKEVDGNLEGRHVIRILVGTKSDKLFRSTFDDKPEGEVDLSFAEEDSRTELPTVPDKLEDKDVGEPADAA